METQVDSGDAAKRPAVVYRSSKKSIRADDATRAVQLSAAILLGGGFYYGFTKQQRIVSKHLKADGKQKGGDQRPPAAPARVRTATLFERGLGLDRPRSAGSAAFRALLGGTIAAFTGATVLVLCAGGALGATNITEFRDRMGDLVPPIREPIEEFDNEEDEMDYLAAIFEEGMQEPVATHLSTSGDEHEH